MKGDHGRGVEMIGQRPRFAGGVQDCEVDCQLASLLGYESPLLACSDSCSFPPSKDRHDRTSASQPEALAKCGPIGEIHGDPQRERRGSRRCPRLTASRWFIPFGGRELPRRLVNLVVGLVIFGAGIGLMLQSGLGVPPWDVLHQGLAVRFGLTVGVMIDVTAVVVPEAGNTMVAILMLGSGILSIGFASGLYIGANLGPGPRDGLMTGIARKGPSIRLTRSILEIVVLIAGWLLGGTFGIGTIAFALLIGPLVQFFLPRWTIDAGRRVDGWEHPAR